LLEKSPDFSSVTEMKVLISSKTTTFSSTRWNMSDNVTVAQGDTKKAVVVTDYVTPVNAMAQLYQTVYVQ